MNQKPELLFEKFEIESVVKKDAGSAVYLARHIYLGKRIFLKTLNTAELNDPTQLHRFKREAKILAKLDHAHIIKVLDFGTFQDRFYISFEYFESKNLRFWLTRRKLTSGQKEYLIAQLAQALNFAHQQGIVHRDLKPENILINDDLQLKIADFGLALLNEENNVTEATSIVGTPAYMSPEQIRGEKLTHKTDLFNLGLIIFEMFKGKNPFLGADVGQTLNNILNFDPQQLRAEYDDLPSNIIKILDGLLQKNPDERFASAGEILPYLPFKNELSGAPFVDHRKSILKAVVLIAVPLFLILAMLIFFNQRETKSPKSSGIVVPESLSAVPGHGSEKNSLTASEKILPEPKERRKAVRKTMVSKPTRPGEKIKTVPKIGRGTLWIECLPWAKVTVDSAQTFTTPLKQPVTLTEGTHRLLFRHPAYPSYETRIRIRAGEESLFKVNLDTVFGFLDCQVFPWGKIYVDGRFVDVSPLKKPMPLKEGEHRLTIRNPQFPDYQKTVAIRRRDTLHIRVNFTELGAKK